MTPGHDLSHVTVHHHVQGDGNGDRHSLGHVHGNSRRNIDSLIHLHLHLHGHGHGHGHGQGQGHGDGYGVGHDLGQSMAKPRPRPRQ